MSHSAQLRNGSCFILNVQNLALNFMTHIADAVETSS